MKPVIFGTLMVQAILEGRKTQTRRVVSKEIVDRFDICNVDGPIAYIDQATGDSYKPTDVARYHPGDVLWVCETWRMQNHGYSRESNNYEGQKLEYRADFTDSENACYDRRGGCAPCKRRPSIHMPREAARIFLRVTDVRVERVQEILCGDMKAEGCIPPTVNGGQWQQWQRDYFAPLWDSINAKRGYGWDTNPWVWVYTFERISKEEARA